MRKNKTLRMHKRYMVILRHLQGHLNNEIAEMELLCANTVRTYINNYKKYGHDGLTMGHSTGAPRLLSNEQEKELIQTITNNTPDKVSWVHSKKKLDN